MLGRDRPASNRLSPTNRSSRFRVLIATRRRGETFLMTCRIGASFTQFLPPVHALRQPQCTSIRPIAPRASRAASRRIYRASPGRGICGLQPVYAPAVNLAAGRGFSGSFEDRLAGRAGGGGREEGSVPLLTTSMLVTVRRAAGPSKRLPQRTK